MTPQPTTWADLKAKYAPTSTSTPQNSVPTTYADLKAKYANYQPPAPPKPKNRFLPGGGDIDPTKAPQARADLVGAIPTVGAIAGGAIGAAGGLALGGPGGAYAGGVAGAGIGGAAGKSLQSAMQGKPQSPGAIAGTGAEYAAGEAIGIPVAKAAEPLVKGAVNLATPVVKKGFDATMSAGGKVASYVGNKLIGSDAAKTLAQLADTETKRFLPVEQGGEGKTFSTVVKGTKNAVDTFVSRSKAALKAVKNAIPDIKVDPKKIETMVNSAVMRSVGSGASYKGVAEDVIGGVKSNASYKEATTMFNSPSDLINSGILNEDEVASANGMMNVIKNWKDNSARGALNLKEELSSFYKDGANGSNAILRNIQNGLKDIVAEAHPPIRAALETASKNIDKADDFTRSLLGKSEQTGESKLKTIATNLKDPTLKGYEHGLIEDLKNATGHDLMSELEGYANYKSLLGQAKGDVEGIPTKGKTILKGIVTGPVGKTIGAIGATGIVAGGLDDLAKITGL